MATQREYSREVKDTRLVDVIPGGAGKIEVLAQPVTLDLCLKAALDDGIARKLAQRALRKLEDVRSYTVFL